MLSLVPWQTRLQPLTNLRVEIAANVDAVMESRLPEAVYLVLGRDRVQHTALSTNVEHRVTSEILMLTRLQRGRGEDEELRDRLSEIRGPLLGALINWMPPGTDNSVIWLGGEGEDIDSQAVVWMDVFTADWWWQLHA